MKISPLAQEMIINYKELLLGNARVTCPYFNNKKTGKRAGLRVLIGKGSPIEITDEASLIALKEHLDLFTASKDEIRKFLVDQNLGVDCSAFAYHVLSAQVKDKTNKQLKNIITFAKTNNFFRKIIQKIRIVENTNVQVLSDDVNSHEVVLSDIKPADMIIMKGFSGGATVRDHVLIVSEVDDNKIVYHHSLKWNTDTYKKHGIKMGEIFITDKTKLITDQTWHEGQKKGDENETLQRALKSSYCAIRRLNILDEKK